MLVVKIDATCKGQYKLLFAGLLNSLSMALYNTIPSLSQLNNLYVAEENKQRS